MTVHLRSVVTAALACVLSGTISVAAAQSAAAVPGAGARLASLATSSSKSDSLEDIEITLPSVTVSGAPRSFQVISIPVPEAFSRVMKLEIEVVPRGEFVVLGAERLWAGATHP